MTTLTAGSSFAQRRHRCAELERRRPFAAEVLRFYRALLDVQEVACADARARAVTPGDAATFAATQVLPRVVEVSAVHGPALLQQAVLVRFDAIDLEAVCRAWLHGAHLDAFDRFLARAATAPVLEALGSRAGEACDGERDERHCPVCGGPPQLAYFAASDDDLVASHRYLECARCAAGWAFTRMTCAACGATEGLQVLGERGTLEAEISGRTIRAELDAMPDESLRAEVAPQFASVRIDACGRCTTYLLTIDLGRDRAAVPVVDEIASIPLTLCANERGFRKILPNLMGF